LSCDEVQGFLISKPVSASEVPAMLRKRFLFPVHAVPTKQA
jgi:EAL domain-containing protein (putative c-di-GMP-specific phosphodiesterase class I)